MKNEKLIIIFLIAVYLIFKWIIFIVMLIFYFRHKKLNTHPKTDEIIYSPPFEYDYAIVNGIYLNDLHNETGSVNVNGLTIEIAKLIKKNYISVSIDDDVIDKEEKITLVLNHMNIKKLNSTDKEIINILQLFSKHDMTLKDIKTKLNNKSVLKKFIFQLKIWKRDIEQKNRINPNEYYRYEHVGNVEIVAILTVFASIIRIIIYGFLMHIAFIIAAEIILIMFSILLFFTSKVIMGHYTEMGYYHLTKWIMFKNYLSSEDELQKHSPDDWEDILLYACCFGIENDVIKNFKKINVNVNNNDLEKFIENDGVKILSDIFYKEVKRI